MDLTIPRPQDLGYLAELKKENGSLSIAEYARILHSFCRRQEPENYGRDLKSEFRSLELLVRSWLDHEWEICRLCLKAGKKIVESNVVSKAAFGSALATPPPGSPAELVIPGEWLADDGVTVITFPDKFVGCRQCIAELERQAGELRPAPQTGLIPDGEFAGWPNFVSKADRAAYMDVWGPEYLLRGPEWQAKRNRYVELSAVV